MCIRDRYYGYEIMEANYEFYFHDGTTVKHNPIKDLIGHFEMPLVFSKEYQNKLKDKVLSIIEHNKPIIEEAKSSKFIKSERLKVFIANYEKEVDEVSKLYNTDR